MNPPSNYPSRSQSRAEVLPPPPSIRERGDTTPNPTPSIHIPTTPSSHIRTSPQKSVRTYDSKFISREMDRLGLGPPSTHVHSHSHTGLPHNLPHAMTPSSSTAALSLVPSLSHGAGSSMMSSSSSSTPPSSDAPWATLHVYVLPLFNGEPLRLAVEDLNSLVKKHLQSVVARAPSRAISNLESDLKELLATGMITLNSKVNGAEDDQLLVRVVELWSFFWDQILPYVEGVFLPLQNDQLLLSLMRAPKPLRSTSPARGHHAESAKTVTLNSPPIDPRKLILQSFRDAIVLPIFERMHALLTIRSKEASATYAHSRLQQMLLVLSSIQSHSLSLTAASPPPSPGEHATSHLLAAIRNPSSPLSPLHLYAGGRARPRSMGPTSFSGGAPRDRRGRIARKDILEDSVLGLIPSEASSDGENEDEGIAGETPTMNGHRSGKIMNSYRNSGMTAEILREKEFLDSLRSPVVDQDGIAGGRFANQANEGVYSVEYDYDSDEHSDDDEDQTARTGLSMNDWEHRWPAEKEVQEEIRDARRIEGNRL